MNARVVILPSLLVAALCVCGARQAPSRSTPARTRVLFIGNSLTTTNDLPGLVEKLSAAGGGPPIACRTVAFQGYSLEDHWNRGDARRAISEGGWSVVVLQQGPSALPESRVLLRDYTRRFNAEARRVGARTALYMVWPSAARRRDFDGVKGSYEAAARDVGGLFLPVGEAWRAAWQRDATLELYGGDGFHPTPLASYLGALVIYQRLSGGSPIGLPAMMTTPAKASLLQSVAAEVNAQLSIQK